jgi:phage/plasmid-like protein (TIGR03299 family)
MGIDNYNTIGGVETMMSARFTPWHGLSEFKIRTEDRITSGDKALNLGGINWRVNERLLSDILPNPLANEHKMRIRESDGAILGIGSPRYGLIQNDALAQLSDAIIQFRPDAHIESCGALFHGKVTWMLIALDDEVRTFANGDEKQFRYMLVYTSHDGSKPFAVRFTNVRVECMNTFSMAMGKANQMVHTIRHTSNAAQYIYEAENAVKAAVQTFDLLDIEIERLLMAEMSQRETVDLFKKVMGDRPDEKGRAMTLWDNTFDAIVAEFKADHNDNIRGTAWGAVMAVNGYELWGQTVRGQKREEKQFKALLDGKYPLTEKALALV